MEAVGVGVRVGAGVAGAGVRVGAGVGAAVTTGVGVGVTVGGGVGGSVGSGVGGSVGSTVGAMVGHGVGEAGAVGVTHGVGVTGGGSEPVGEAPGVPPHPTRATASSAASQWRAGRAAERLRVLRTVQPYGVATPRATAGRRVVAAAWPDPTTPTARRDHRLRRRPGRSPAIGYGCAMPRTSRPSPSDRGVFARTAGAAALVTTVVALPTLLLGGLAVLVQRELGFGQAQLGIAVATSFGIGALAAPVAGRLAERLGPRRVIHLALLASGISLLGVGLVARSWLVLVPLVGVAGLGITLAQLGTNVLVARRVPAGRQGLAFGLKQAAVPFASLLAGLALPLVGLTLGWRAAFLLAAVLLPLVALVVPDAAPVVRRDDGPPRGASLRSLLVLAVGVALASAAGNSVPAFAVASAVDRGLPDATAGLVLAIGSVVGIAVRVAGGWSGDRLGRGALVLVVALLLVGTAGFAGLAVARDPVSIAVCTALAFGGGWGWAGLVPLAVSRTNPDAPGRAMGIVQVGPMAGAVAGPLVFGVAADAAGFTAAWMALATFAVAGAATILLSRRMLRRSRAEAYRVEGAPTRRGGDA